MVTFENHVGRISLSEKYLTELISHTVCGCFGVAGLCPSEPLSRAVSAFTHGKIQLDNGIHISSDKGNNIIIDLHICVAYGTNIPETVKNLTHKVGFAVEESIGIEVNQVNVFVDEMR